VSITPPWFIASSKWEKICPARLCAQCVFNSEGELNELETFVGAKKTCIWFSTAVDHKKPELWGWVLPSRLCLGRFAPNWAVVGRAMLRILDWWMVSKSWFYSRMRPNCQLDLLDTGGKGKYPVAALSARVASQDSARWVKIRGKAQIQGFGCYSTISNSGMSPFLKDS